MRTHTEKPANANTRFWQFPWGYRESFTISGTLLLTGFAIEWASRGQEITMPGFPLNLITGALFFVSLVILNRTRRGNPLVKWLESVPAAFSGMSLFMLLVLAMGLIPQEESISTATSSRLGLHHLTRSWPFVLLQIYLLTSLGLITLKRLRPFRGRNIGFFLNHAGLWLVIAAGALSSGDVRTINMVLPYGQTVWYGKNQDGQTVELPLALKLHEFDVDYFAPKLALAHGNTGKILKVSEFLAGQTHTPLPLGRFTVEIDTFLQLAKPFGGSYHYNNDVGAAPAARLSVRQDKETLASGWVCSGSFALQPAWLPLGPKLQLVMLEPEPQKFTSRLSLFTKSGEKTQIDLAVNQPYKHGAWHLYQYDYDESKGQWSEVSIIQAVYDPWLYVIYTGLGMLIAGALYLFWAGRKKIN